LIGGKGLTKTLPLLEKQDQRDKLLFLRTRPKKKGICGRETKTCKASLKQNPCENKDDEL